jgi:signal transduction histidine kinase
LEISKHLIIDIETPDFFLKTKEAVKNFTLGINHPNRILFGFSEWSLNQSNEIIEIVISFIDITERKLMEIELLKSKNNLKQRKKAKTDANMSHEIRTPLNGIIGFTHLLMKSKWKRIRKSI